MNITPELKNEFLAELRDIEGFLSLIAGYEDSIKEITAESKEKYGISPGDMKGMAKKNMEDKLSEEIEKTSTKVDWMTVVKEGDTNER